MRGSNFVFVRFVFRLFDVYLLDSRLRLWIILGHTCFPYSIFFLLCIFVLRFHNRLFASREKCGFQNSQFAITSESTSCALSQLLVITFSEGLVRIGNLVAARFSWIGGFSKTSFLLHPRRQALPKSLALHQRGFGRKAAHYSLICFIRNQVQWESRKQFAGPRATDL